MQRGRECPAGMDMTGSRCGLRCCPARTASRSQLTRAVLADAAESLGRWRRAGSRVGQPAVQADSPGNRRARSATPSTKTSTRWRPWTCCTAVESGHDMPAGAKFETFVFVDRVLGLELAREIGR